MSLFLEIFVLLIFGFLMFLTHRNVMKAKMFESDSVVESVENIDEKIRYFLSNFILKILIRVKILVLQLSNFLENNIQKINKNATKKNKIS